jgi:dTDP-4-dehydrorhamnose reductase
MLLLIGGDSEIGNATFREYKTRGTPITATTRRATNTPDRMFLDLTAPLHSWEPPEGTTTACICAAVARLAACATDPEGTAYLNVTQTVALVEKLLLRGIHVLFLSSNQVFDGRHPQMPAAAPHAPISEYGRQKARAEAALQAFGAHGAPISILRLSKVLSPDTALIQRWIEALTAGRAIQAFRDMTLSPVPVDLVCAAIIALTGNRARGTFQLSGPTDVTYGDVARLIAGKLKADPALVSETSFTSANLPEGIAPRHTTLDSSLLEERYGIAASNPTTVIGKITEAFI